MTIVGLSLQDTSFHLVAGCINTPDSQHTRYSKGRVGDIYLPKDLRTVYGRNMLWKRTICLFMLIGLCIESSRCQVTQPAVSPECNVETCLNGGSCAPVELGKLCDCPQGFTGSSCETIADCINTPRYCENGATCIPGIEGLPVTCQCLPGFKGDQCETFSCEAGTCQNQGTCYTEPEFLKDGKICNCSPLFTGTYCEVRVDCNVETCLNGGACNIPEIALANNSLCFCPDQFTGNFCETMINCVHDPALCQNGGSCIDGLCMCPFGFTGSSCDVYECGSGTCQNGGTCQPGSTDPATVCTCRSGYMGSFCDEIDTEAMCLINCNNGECSSNHTCECNLGYHGIYCNDIIPCEEMPCQNGGECFGRQPQRRKRQEFELLPPTLAGCSCLIEYTGLYCETERPPCELECQNKGRCELSPESFDYICQCSNRNYYSGELCEVVALCFEIGCEFNGICDEQGKCVCPDGRYGAFCEQDICDTNPCANGGICFQPTEAFSEIQIVTDEFYCACAPGFRGPTCTGEIVECSRNEFACESGECISLSKMCDNVPYDCADNSDEPDECQKAECDDLLQLLNALTERCGELQTLGAFPTDSLESQNVFQFSFGGSDFPDAPTIIAKV
ncbi:uncharacterized protein [Antedon mediterranea]|uniref:uncharacterized protein n=1 Tax=Antedon mediterranea TaxID=105859 RepID=UPI003AF6E67E